MVSQDWSSVVGGIERTRSVRALFFKPVCVIAAIDLADEGRHAPNDLDAEAIVGRFSDLLVPFFSERAADGFQPLWHLANNRLWTFFDGDRALTSSDFPRGRPSTMKILLDKFDRLSINERVLGLWSVPEKRRMLRDRMLLMLEDGDRDSRSLVRPLFDPRHVANVDRWPSAGIVAAYLAPLRQPSLFDGPEPDSGPPGGDALPPGTDTNASAGSPLRPAPEPIEDVPSPVDYVWVDDRVVVASNTASWPIFPSASSAREHASRLEACAVHARDLVQDLRRRRWQVRDDYMLQIERYADRLPTEPGSGNVLLADASIRILRDLFAAEQLILPAPFAAALRALMQQHIALRPYYPELESFYRAVRTGRIAEALPLDAIDGIMAVVREQTPSVFGESVSAAIAEASAPQPAVSAVDGGSSPEEGIIVPPPDPLGALDGSRAHDFQVAGAFNRLWKVFRASNDVHSSTIGWIKTYNDLSEPITAVLHWLRDSIG